MYLSNDKTRSRNFRHPTVSDTFLYDQKGNQWFTDYAQQVAINVNTNAAERRQAVVYSSCSRPPCSANGDAEPKHRDR